MATYQHRQLLRTKMTVTHAWLRRNDFVQSELFAQTVMTLHLNTTRKHETMATITNLMPTRSFSSKTDIFKWMRLKPCIILQSCKREPNPCKGSQLTQMSALTQPRSQAYPIFRSLVCVQYNTHRRKSTNANQRAKKRQVWERGQLEPCRSEL